MSSTTNNRWLHRFAWLTAVLTLLLPVTTGAIVTTLEAGMAFPDWPTSDGHSMLAYPWLGAARDQFIEHGHRLAGMVIGLLSIGLATVAWTTDERPLVHGLAISIVGVVVAQGLLGGARVLLDRDTLALVHGDFAAAVFSLMASLVLVTGSGWDTRPRLCSAEISWKLRLLASATFVLIAIQYFFGGVLRHLGTGWAWLVHPWFAIAPLVVSLVVAWVARRVGHQLVSRVTTALTGLVIAQALLGLATWYVRYGVPSWGVVAERHSIAQVVVCSLHKVLGMLTIMTSVLMVIVVRACRPMATGEHKARSFDFGNTVAGAAT